MCIPAFFFFFQVLICLGYTYDTVITQTCEDIYLYFLYIGLNIIRLSSYLLFTLWI